MPQHQRSGDQATAPGGGQVRAGPAWRSPSALAIFAAVVATGVAADLVSKSCVFDWLGDYPNHSRLLFPGLRFTLSTNPGIVFGLLVPPWLVLAATLAAAVTVVVLLAGSDRRWRGLHAALGMVLGGSIGNAYDRLFSRVSFAGELSPRVGQVRDFIHVYPINYPVFNVADMLLVVGVGLILLHMFRQRKERS